MMLNIYCNRFAIIKRTEIFQYEFLFVAPQKKKTIYVPNGYNTMSMISFYVPILQQKNSYRVSGREVSDDAVLRWGYGTEYSLDGGHVIYSGQWEDGLRHGFGTEYQDTPRVYYKGQWKAGQHHGKGRDVLDGEANYYEGTAYILGQ